MKLNEILALPNGARFYRADLHIHSFGSSHDVKDATMTPDSIVRTAIKERLDVIAVADHNEIGNVTATVAAAVGTGVFVVPAVELSTAHGHLLCYLPQVDSLEKFYGGLDIVDRGTGNSRCQTSLLECLNRLLTLGGFAILAHVDGPGGFEFDNAGNSPHKADVLSHEALLGIELKDAVSPISYSDTDPDANRRKLGQHRVDKLALGSRQFLARTLNSDSHTLDFLGKNAAGLRKVTRVKMAIPSFRALRIAMEDSDARVRIEEQIPTTVPQIIGLHIDGGFLDGQEIHFSSNLTCIIGGRGTGKSTAFEAARCLTGDLSASSLVDSEAWPSHLTLFWQDQAGQQHTLTRSISGTVLNVDDPVHGPTSFKIDSYGQGETARISKKAQDDPLALLDYLDGFVDLEVWMDEENAARDRLLEIQTKIEEATKKVEAIPQYQKALTATRGQLTALEKAKATEVIALQRKLAEEREVRSQILTKLDDIRDQVNALSPHTSIDELVNVVDPTTLVVGSNEFQGIINSARKFESIAKTAQSDAKLGFKELRAAVDTQLTAWKAKEAETAKEIEKKRKELEAQNIRLDMAFITKLAKDEARLQSELNVLLGWKPKLLALQKERSEDSTKRWNARERVGMAREAYGKSASDILKSALTDLSVSLKFMRSAYSPDAEALIVQAMGWRTVLVPRAALLIEQLTLPGLLKAIDKNDSAAIMSVMNGGAKVFDKPEAERLVKQLAQPAIRFALERCEVHDLPRLSVTKTIPDPSGTPKIVTRDFSKLSLGQQQSVLLALMLSSTSNAPLIIDQPEDNLDGEFIYRSIVPVLRRAKERRQIIVVTHNPNIAVLGDAEQIVVLRSTSDKGFVVSRGSIDDSETRDDACKILEGAKEAFKRRSKIYGIT